MCMLHIVFLFLIFIIDHVLVWSLATSQWRKRNKLEQRRGMVVFSLHCCL